MTIDETTRRPIDSKTDIYPWPYEWTQDIEPRVLLHLAVIKQFHPELEFWSYMNHRAYSGPVHEPRHRWITDLYWEDPKNDRGQVPPAAGDSIVALLVELFAPEIQFILWNSRRWRPETGWTDWNGAGGDFVWNIHVEWNALAFPAD